MRLNLQFFAEAESVPDSPEKTTVKGIWVFNETLIPSPQFTCEGVTVSFISNGRAFKCLWEDGDSFYNYILYCLITAEEVLDGGTTTDNSIVVCDGAGWIDTVYKTIDFGETEQVVSGEFYAWLTANATQQKSEDIPAVTNPTSDILFDYDFIGFTYGGVHNIRDLKIYRTSDGSRYNNNLNPTFNDKAVEISGKHGQLPLYSYHKQKTFTINFAFDSLTKNDIDKLKEVFNGLEVKELIFDECPYKAYLARVSGQPTIKYVPFDENGQEIYKGEGTLNFTCYQPYAQTPTNDTKCPLHSTIGHTIYAGIYMDGGEEGTTLKINGVPENTDNIFVNGTDVDIVYEIDKDNQKIFSIHFASENSYLESIKFTFVNDKGENEPINMGGKEVSFGEFFTNSWGLVGPDKRTFNGYSLGQYPTKHQWKTAADLENIEVIKHVNRGDVPAPVIVKTNGAAIGDKILFGEKGITFKQEYEDTTDITWNTAIGIIKTNKPILTDGISVIKIQPGASFKPQYYNGTTKNETKSLALEYKYLYY